MLRNLTTAHGGLWAGDPWYRRAWFVGPQATALLAAGSLIWSLTSGAAPDSSAPWASPIQSVRSAMDWDALRDKAKSDRSAFDRLASAAESGDRFAQFSMGTLYDPVFKLSQLFKPDIDTAIAWYLKAAEQGHLPAQVGLGVLYYENQYGRASDYEKSAFWYEKAVDQGNLKAMHNLSALVYRGAGVPMDHARAIRLIREAAAGGNPDSQFYLGLSYKTGNDVVQANAAESAKWFEKSAENKNTQAMNSVGIAYADGNGVERNFDRARYWFKRGADAGNKDAEANLLKLPQN